MTASVKGMTVCTPEFHRTVKQNENKVEILDKLIQLTNELCNLVGENSINNTTEYNLARNQLKDIFEL
ncbi:hypothetical protein B1B04_24440 [Lysinibacillus sp. KCTC 33748]|uniref:hypothetical protein n=1 Tax=unclassified Lysinibacillus TaxID=2636778 RepID=UPI0009A8776F|nr:MULTISPECIES: hypothetical protein [unclassified Lysinibacillus]OXS66097.1 hypothetical protein B1B04_24440 [Lysinibacillus sp. KCTC 33748]SKC18455.1 hypothetical protein SAMN06295926_13729 [Lysinibacillus sp. AC-3]